MSTSRKIAIGTVVFLLVFAAGAWWVMRGNPADLSVNQVAGTDPELVDPQPEKIPTVGIAQPIGWTAGAAPTAAAGLTVTRFAEGLDHPRILYRLPNGDVLVALTNAPPGNKPGGIKGWIMGLLFKQAGAAVPSPNQIVLLRDADGNGQAESRSVLREGLSSPSGMAWHDGTLYVADHDALLAFSYALGQTRISGTAKKLMDLPGGGNHWMRNLLLSPDGTRLYVAVGSASNIGERGMDAETGRAAIWEYDIASGVARQYAAGLRNPNGLAWNPQTGELWTTVNERDQLGSDLVPDYLTNVPVGAQYGWPWLYYRSHIDDRVTAPMPAYLMEYARDPEFALGPHVAALGLKFSGEGDRMGTAFANGAFIARHGSWNRKPASGYDVVFVNFDARGNPTGKPVPVLTGFLTGDGTTHGRPTWVEWDKTGALLVSDDTGGIVWRVIAPAAAPNPARQTVVSDALPPKKDLTGQTVGSFGAQDYARIEPEN